MSGLTWKSGLGLKGVRANLEEQVRIKGVNVRANLEEQVRKVGTVTIRLVRLVDLRMYFTLHGIYSQTVDWAGE